MLYFIVIAKAKAINTHNRAGWSTPAGVIIKGLNMVDKSPNMVDKKVVNKASCSQNLTPAEVEVLFLLSNEFLTANKIAIRRECSKQAVSKIICSLKRKGAINNAYSPSETMVDKIVPTSQPSTTFVNQIRLHAQEFHIKIIYKSEKYKEILKHSNTITIDGNTIRLYKNSIEIYSGHSFYSDTVQKATVKSFEYWNRLFTRMEHDLKAILVKPRAQNIKLVNQHYAEINNELAQEVEKKEKIRIYTTEDGKLWFTIDNSFNLHEAETLHPETAKEDMAEAIMPLFNDLRDNHPPTLSQVMSVINQAVEVNKETAAGLNSVVSLLKSQLPPEEKPEGRPDYFG